MGMVLNPGRMAPNTKDNINLDTRKAKGSCTGQTVAHTQGSLITITSVDSDGMNGQMAEYTKDTGSTIGDMARGNLTGKMVGATMESTNTTSSMVSVSTFGQTVLGMKESG